MDNRPIGVMDSGLGGLSVVRVLRQELPEESVIFVGDEGHFPYGTKSQDEIKRFVVRIGQFLEDQDAKLMVIACNTATAAALTTVQKELTIPVIGVIHPGAVAASKNAKERVGIIATESTTSDGAYVRELNQLAPTLQVISKATQPLVSIVEHGKTGKPEAQETVHEQLAIFKDNPVDTLILGCTHFPFLSAEIEKELGKNVTLIDPALETVEEVKSLLTENDQLSNKPATVNLYSTGNRNDLLNGVEKWLDGKYDKCDSLEL
ncbi:glutamate racemase [Lactobacillaceae bacterium 24-114]